MELKELRNVWKRQKTSSDMNYSKTELLMLLNNKMASFEKDIQGRDRRELIACAFVIIAFGVSFFAFSSLWIKLGCAIIILSAIFIAYKLKKAQPKKLDSKLSHDHSVVHHLKLELENVREQKKLLKSIAWWYITPICTGLIIFTIGSPWYLTVKVIYGLIVIAMGIGMWFLNQKAVSKRLNPLIQEIEESLKFMEINK